MEFIPIQCDQTQCDHEETDQRNQQIYQEENNYDSCLMVIHVLQQQNSSSQLLELFHNVCNYFYHHYGYERIGEMTIFNRADFVDNELKVYLQMETFLIDCPIVLCICYALLKTLSTWEISNQIHLHSQDIGIATTVNYNGLIYCMKQELTEFQSKLLTQRLRNCMYEDHEEYEEHLDVIKYYNKYFIHCWKHFVSTNAMGELLSLYLI